MESFGIVGGLRCRSGWHEEEEELGVIPVGATGQRSRGTRIIGRAGRSECRAGNEKISNDPVFREDDTRGAEHASRAQVAVQQETGTRGDS